MIYEFRLPDIGEGVAEGEVVRWLVKEGDALEEDQPMVEIMTDKATVEIGSPRVGRVAKRMFAEGERCPVGKVLIAIEVEGEDRAGSQAPSAHAPKAAAAVPSARPATGRRPATPFWRRRPRASWRATSASTSERSRVPAGQAGSPLTTSARTGVEGVRRSRPRRRAPMACGSLSAGCAGRSPRRWSGRSKPRRTSPTSRRSTAPSWWRSGLA